MVLRPEHKKFVIEQLAKFSAYDALRPENRTYKFAEHSERVAANMKSLAEELGYDQTMCDNLYWATLIHDIGKMVLPVKIWDYHEKGKDGNWLKPPEDLKEQRRAHTTLGVDMVKKAFPETWNTDPFLMMVCNLMQNHHEHIDGTGYLGKTEKDLTQEAQMLCICDAFDGWTIPRPHKKAEELNPIYVIETKMMDGRFNKNILKPFKEMILCRSKPYSLLPLSS